MAQRTSADVRIEIELDGGALPERRAAVLLHKVEAVATVRSARLVDR